MRWLVMAFGLGAAALALPAFSQEVDCETAMTQMDINICAKQEFTLADALLNDAYADARRTMRDLDTGLQDGRKGAEAALKEAQRAWITFRDTACEAEGFLVRGGTAEAMVIYGCLARLTDQRTSDLQILAQGFEG